MEDTANMQLMTWLAIPVWVVIGAMMVHQLRSLRRPRRIFSFKTMLALFDLPVHGTIKTPATVLVHCPMDSSWEVRFSVATDARLYEFSVPREQMYDVAFVNASALDGPDVHWSSESLNLLLTRDQSLRGQRFFTIMVDLPDDEGTIAVNLQANSVRDMLSAWDRDTPLTADGLSERLDEELENLLKKD